MIICDVDGTLLPAHQEKIDPFIINEIKRLVTKNVAFVIASGRTYSELKILFSEVINLVYFVCADGAKVLYKQETVYEQPIEQNKADRILKLLSDTKTEIYQENGKIFRVSAYEKNNPIVEKAKIFIKNNNLALQVWSDNVWCDFIDINADKGKAISYLQNKLHITYEQTVAFGDNTNDIGLLRSALYSYAVKNAKPEIKILARYTANSVLEELKKYYG